MKKSVLLGLALLMAMNSAALAESNRVSNIANKTAEERAANRNELLADLNEARQNLTGILDHLDEAIDKRNAQIGTSLATAAITVVMALAKRKTVQAVIKSGTGGGMGFVNFAAEAALIYSALSTARQINDALFTMDQITELRDMANKMNTRISELEQQVGQGAI